MQPVRVLRAVVTLIMLACVNGRPSCLNRFWLTCERIHKECMHENHPVCEGRYFRCKNHNTQQVTAFCECKKIPYKAVDEACVERITSYENTNKDIPVPQYQEQHNKNNTKKGKISRQSSNSNSKFKEEKHINDNISENGKRTGEGMENDTHRLSGTECPNESIMTSGRCSEKAEGKAESAEYSVASSLRVNSLTLLILTVTAITLRCS